ncbi:MAG: protein tyrosine/serine phosphatase [Novosphingobium sp.]|nr:protein tyrosine/serine phosphatase [Novosphingobium sp.]
MTTNLARFTSLLAIVIGLASATAYAAPPADAVVERGAAGELVVHWTSSDPVDVLMSDRADAQPGKAALVAARDHDGRETIASSSAPRSYFTLRNSRTGETTHVAERLIPLEAGSNFRDIGGYPAAEGKHIRWGMIYRSGGTPLLTAADLDRVHALGLTNMVDLRSDEERILAPTRIDGVAYTAVGYSMAKLDVAGGMETTYKGLPTMMAPQLRQIFAKLLRSEQPLAYNCSAGQDRTGFVTAIVLTALGVPRETIVADYHLSTKYRRPEFEMPRLDPAAHRGDPVATMFASFQDNPQARKARPLMTADGTPFLAFALTEIEAKWGSVGGYLTSEIGLSKADVSRLRALYTE